MVGFIFIAMKAYNANDLACLIVQMIHRIASDKKMETNPRDSVYHVDGAMEERTQYALSCKGNCRIWISADCHTDSNYWDHAAHV